MTRKIYKYELDFFNEVRGISMPPVLQFLCVKSQGGKLTLWVEHLIVSEGRHCMQEFLVVGTGVDFPKMKPVMQSSRYIGTAEVGLYVWHVYAWNNNDK
jgi:hypothetical protein